MLYLYTIMMFAWDLDPDTHSYLREYLDVFINKRKISKDLREFVPNTRNPAITFQIRQSRDEEHKFNKLRISLPYRVVDAVITYKGSSPKWWRMKSTNTPILIEKLHPPKYHHDARKLSAPSQKHTNP